jgi:D-inositol-3-phosphate glycosyltransferase
MRIGMISFHTSPLSPLGKGKAGGMNAYIQALGRQLAEKGVEVDCFTRLQDEKTPTIQEAGPRMRLVSLPAGPPSPLPPHLLFPHLKEFQIGMEDFLEDERSHGGYDLLHAHYYLSGWIGLRLRQLWRIPLVFTFHTIGPLKDEAMGQGEPGEPGERRQIEEEVAHGADLIIASSPHEGSSLRRLYQVADEHLAIVPCGVDIDLFRPRDPGQARYELRLSSGKILLFVGRLEAIKGIGLLLQGLARIRSDLDLPSDLRPTLVIVGEAEEKNPWKDQADRLGLSPWVLFAGAQPRKKMPLYYAACDAVVIPSRYESFGLVALEAAACGCPVIATSVGGLPYAVRQDRTGLLVPMDDVEALALAIRRLLIDDKLANRLGGEGRKWAQELSWSRISDRILSLYPKVLGIAAPSGMRIYA